MSTLIKFEDVDIYKSSKFLKDFENYSKKYHCKKEIDELSKFLNRGIKVDLRYEFNLNNEEFHVQVYYVRWPIIPNIGKSHNTRFWFSFVKELKVLIMLCIYMHNEGIDDIEKSEAIKLTEKAILEYLSTLGDNTNVSRIPV